MLPEQPQVEELSGEQLSKDSHSGLFFPKLRFPSGGDGIHTFHLAPIVYRGGIFRSPAACRGGGVFCNYEHDYRSSHLALYLIGSH